MAFIFLFGDLLNWANWIMAVARRVIELGFTEGDVVGLSGLRVRGRNQRGGSNVRRCPLVYRETSFFARHLAELVFDRRHGF